MQSGVVGELRKGIMYKGAEEIWGDGYIHYLECSDGLFYTNCMKNKAVKNEISVGIFFLLLLLICLSLVMIIARR